VFQTLIKKRRSIRKYTKEPLSDQILEALAEAAIRTPSSKSRTPWTFVFVTDPDLLKELAQAKPHGATFLKDAPLGVVVCGEPDRCDIWIEDCSIASTFLFLAAESLGLGACWIQIRLRTQENGAPAEDYIKKLLDLPPNLHVESIIAIGHPAETKTSHPKSSLDFDRIIFRKAKE
jgi:nitroreductase